MEALQRARNTAVATAERGRRKTVRRSVLDALTARPPTLEIAAQMARLLARAHANGNNRSLNAAVAIRVKKTIPAAFRHALQTLRGLTTQVQNVSNANVARARTIRNEAHAVARECAGIINATSPVFGVIVNGVSSVESRVADLEFLRTQQRRLRGLRTSSSS